MTDIKNDVVPPQARALAAVHLDAVGGIAGDMFVAALLDCFPHLIPRVMADLEAVRPEDGSAAQLSEVKISGMRARRFGVTALHHHAHTHDADEGHHHGSSYAHIHAHIMAAPLSDGTTENALAILIILAEAEAKMHAVAIEDVHFHEIGDWDSILDVVAAGSIIAALGALRWTVSPLPLGSGLVKTAHGLLPVPAPATAEILKGFDWRDDGVPGERVTPTGAAILRHLCGIEPGQRQVDGTLLAVGTGAGTKVFDRLPNILRATAFSSSSPSDLEDIVALLFDVDDMTGEEMATAADWLRRSDGVLDLTLCNIQGKKGRPSVRFELLARPELLQTIVEDCFSQTSTIGVRWSIQRRSVLERHMLRRAEVDVKIVQRPAGVTAKAEQDHLAGIDTLAGRRAKQTEATQLEEPDNDTD